MQKPMKSCHLIPAWHEWNTNANDIMMMWFTLYVTLVTSHLACTSCTQVHGACALNKYGTYKYPSGLGCTQADLNLAKIPHNSDNKINNKRIHEKRKRVSIVSAFVFVIFGRHSHSSQDT